MADYSIRPEVHPEGSFNSNLSMLIYLYDLKVSVENGWTRSNTTPRPDSTPYESQSSKPATSGTHCPSGVSTPRQVDGAEWLTATGLLRDAAQLTQSSAATYPGLLQRPWTGRKPPTHYHHTHGQLHQRTQPTGIGHNPETPGSQVPYQSNHSSVYAKDQDGTQRGRHKLDCTPSFQQKVSPGGQGFAQQRQTTQGSEGGSKLDKATEEWRRRYVARQTFESCNSHLGRERP